MQLWRMLAKRQVLTHLILAFRKASSSSLPKSKDTSSVSSTRAWGTPNADGRRWPSPPLPSLLEGPLPPRLQSEAFCPSGVRPRPRFAHPPSCPPLSLLLTAPLPCPELSQSPAVLSPILPPQHPRGPTCFMLPRAHLEPTAQAPAPAPAWPGRDAGKLRSRWAGAGALRCRSRVGRGAQGPRGAWGPERSRGLGRWARRPRRGRGLGGSRTQGSLENGA